MELELALDPNSDPSMTMPSSLRGQLSRAGIMGDKRLRRFSCAVLFETLTAGAALWLIHSSCNAFQGIQAGIYWRIL